MTLSEKHINKAEHNRSLCEHLKNLAVDIDFLDWVVTSTFYAALHYFDAFLEDRGRRPRSHSHRDDCIKDFGPLRAQRDNYRYLKDRSREARYEMAVFTADEISRDIVPAFNQIKEAILIELQ